MRVSERVSEREKQETDNKASTPNLLSIVSEITLWKETFGGVCFVAINDCVLPRFVQIHIFSPRLITVLLV